MEKRMKEYRVPTIVTLGTVAELTETGTDKCSGSGDLYYPQEQEQRFAPTGTCPQT